MPTQTGTTGNDYLAGTTGADTLIGLTGNDVYIADDLADVIVEAPGEGNDLVWTNISYTLPAGASVETLAARDFAFTTPLSLTGNELSNLLIGNIGNNILDGGGGADVMRGYQGDDIYYVDHAGDVVVDSNGIEIVYASASWTMTSAQPIETLAARDSASLAALALIGNNQANTIIGNAGNNYIDGGLGADVLRGLGGDDTYVVGQTGDTVEEAVGGGNDLVQCIGNFTLAAGSEVEIIAMQSNSSTTAFTLVGNELVNAILGDNGANRLDGGGGADILVGYNGNDSYVVDNLGDAVFEEAGAGSDTILTSIDWRLSAGLSVEGLAAVDIQATTSLTLLGNELDNTIGGNAGNNFLDGDTGADIMTGNGGNDVYAVDNGADLVFEAVGGGTDTVYTTVNFTLGAGQEVDVLAARDHSVATAMDLTGNELDNTILGNAGANFVDGKGGADSLLSYGGADTFAFTTALGAGNVDWIFGFSAADDTIALDDAVFTGLSAGALPAGAFVVGTAAADADDRILYDSATGYLYFDADGNGAGAAVQFARLVGSPAITAADFMVI